MTKQIADYTFRKTFAIGFLDLALLLENVSQLKILTEQRSSDPTLKIVCMTFLVGCSVILQIVAGCFLIYLGCKENDIRNIGPNRRTSTPKVNNNDTESGNKGFDEVDGVEQVKELGEVRARYKNHSRLNTALTCCIFIIFVVNVIISGMGIGIKEMMRDELSHGPEGEKYFINRTTG